MNGIIVGMIWAEALGGVIGKDNGMPWNVPEDLAHFKRTTSGHPVIMGRHSWEALPETWRPLPGRTNIVLTRNPSWQAEGAIAAPSLETALAELDDDEIWIIGGAKVYADAVDVANLAIVTELDLETDGDAFAPKLGQEWVRESSDPAEGWHLSKTGIRYRMITYRKR